MFFARDVPARCVYHSSILHVTSLSLVVRLGYEAPTDLLLVVRTYCQRETPVLCINHYDTSPYLCAAFLRADTAHRSGIFLFQTLFVLPPTPPLFLPSWLSAAAGFLARSPHALSAYELFRELPRDGAVQLRAPPCANGVSSLRLRRAKASCACTCTVSLPVSSDRGELPTWRGGVLHVRRVL